MSCNGHDRGGGVCYEWDAGHGGRRWACWNELKHDERGLGYEG